MCTQLSRFALVSLICQRWILQVLTGLFFRALSLCRVGQFFRFCIAVDIFLRQLVDAAGGYFFFQKSIGIREQILAALRHQQTKLAVREGLIRVSSRFFQ